MLGAMLGGHSLCVCVPETNFIEQLLAGSDIKLDAVQPQAVLANIVAHERYRVLWNFPLDPWAVDPTDLGSTYAEVLAWLVLAYGRRVGKPNAQIWVDQTPSNLKRGLTMLRMFPDARFIHIVRDGRGVAASVLPLDWGPNDIIRAAEFWMARCAIGLAAESVLGSDRVLRVRYEDLLAGPEPVLRQIAGFAGLEYEPTMVQGIGYAPTRYNERQHRLVGRPPDRSRADSWSRCLTPRQIEIFESVAGDFLELLGYQPRYGIHARPPSFPEVLRLKTSAVVLRLRNRLRQRRRVRASLTDPPAPTV
jgi:Sulfotransferase family